MSVKIHITVNEREDGSMQTKFYAYNDMMTEREKNYADVIGKTVSDKLDQIQETVFFERIIRER